MTAFKNFLEATNNTKSSADNLAQFAKDFNSTVASGVDLAKGAESLAQKVTQISIKGSNLSQKLSNLVDVAGKTISVSGPLGVAIKAVLTGIEKVLDVMASLVKKLTPFLSKLKASAQNLKNKLENNKALQKRLMQLQNVSTKVSNAAGKLIPMLELLERQQAWIEAMSNDGGNSLIDKSTKLTESLKNVTGLVSGLTGALTGLQDAVDGAVTQMKEFEEALDEISQALDSVDGFVSSFDQFVNDMVYLITQVAPVIPWILNGIDDLIDWALEHFGINDKLEALVEYFLPLDAFYEQMEKIDNLVGQVEVLFDSIGDSIDKVKEGLEKIQGYYENLPGPLAVVASAKYLFEYHWPLYLIELREESEKAIKALASPLDTESRQGCITLKSIHMAGTGIGSDWSFTLAMDEETISVSGKGLSEKKPKKKPQFLLGKVYDSATSLNVGITTLEADPKFDDKGGGSGSLSLGTSLGETSGTVTAKTKADGGDEPNEATHTFTFSIEVRPWLASDTDSSKVIALVPALGEIEQTLGLINQNIIQQGGGPFGTLLLAVTEFHKAATKALNDAAKAIVKHYSQACDADKEEAFTGILKDLTAKIDTAWQDTVKEAIYESPDYGAYMLELSNQIDVLNTSDQDGSQGG